MIDAIPLSLYIHTPWCVRKCPYCDFNSHEAKAAIPEQAYIEALLHDLSSELPQVWGRRLLSIFIGGGTPSLLSATAYEQLFNQLRQLLPVRPNTEITLEANPGTFEQDRFHAYRALGINRLSIGIQSFNDQFLQHLGRIHHANEAHRAVKIAQRAGFTNLNLDLMFGLPQQSLAQALDDLQRAIDYQPTHLSWYQLTLEPNTLFHHQPPKQLPDDDLLADIHEAGIQLLSEAGYQQYEVSAFARDEQFCQHNENYWQFGDYLGIGAGAHGKISHYHPHDPSDNSKFHSRLHIQRGMKHKQPEHYLQQMAQGSAYHHQRTLDEQTCIAEFMLNALRLKRGFSTDLFEARTGLSAQLLDERLHKAQALGLLTVHDQHIQTTDKGWLFLNNVIALFLE
ncbi:MAG: radical SAM family heme chaperone HemW [bacterium]